MAAIAVESGTCFVGQTVPLSIVNTSDTVLPTPTSTSWSVTPADLGTVTPLTVTSANFVAAKLGTAKITARMTTAGGQSYTASANIMVQDASTNFPLRVNVGTPT